MIITAIDPGTRSAGIVTIEMNGSDIACLLNLPQKRGIDETEAEFIDRLCGQVNLQAGGRSDLIACEASHYRLNHKTHAALAKVCGAVEQVALRIGLPYVEVQPAEWKKAVTGLGNATYMAIRLCVRSILKDKLISWTTDHEFAAIGVAIAAGRARETKIKLSAAEKGG